MSKKIPNAHDLCFKSFFSREEFVRDFIQYYLPEEVKKHLDLTIIEIDMEGYLSEEFKEFYSDVVAKVYFKDRIHELELYFLFEHKSKPYRFTILQTLNYQVQKWMRLLVDGKLDQYLPIIVPVVIYNGYKGWNFSVQFEDLFQLPSEHFKDFIPQFRHILHDIGQMDEASFKTTTIMEIFHLLLKYIYYPELDTKIHEIYDLLEKFPDNDKLTDYLFIIVRYVMASGAIPEKRLLEHTKRFAGGEEMIGVAAREIEERVERTRRPYWEKQAELKNAHETLIDIATEAYGPLPGSLNEKIKSIQSLENLRALNRKVLRTQSLEEFTELVNRAAQ
ncbi:putative transposase YhgA family protein [Desulfonatronospira thiodismutans ASO3-1]|uniref:Transposase YhgA family protein n=1 Tax=Desulfonatronospira thiodismutans ASO3-1 TaxID=555779 RepID=D6SLC2_9BACT|nr:Rpn family recombination-promoting nuclease/putative transposase [Desulfonatronospira thiodismutans]EFI35483.1 putative transposase YhgA family protein [Desulfonatronospira thiodismutans ASO3-1]